MRSLVTLASLVPLFAFYGCVFSSRSVERLGPFMLILVIGPPMFVCWGLTCKFCRKVVVCPFCGGSLWRCGSGNFKPRRMQVTANCCPQCRAPIV